VSSLKPLLLRTMRAIRTRLSSARTRLIVERDYWTFRLRFGRTLRARELSPDAPWALIPSVHEWVYQLKLEGMMARALQLKGYAPIALVLSGSSIARRYLRLFGVTRFIELASYIDETTRARARSESATIMGERRSAEELKTLAFDGADIGRQVLSTASRSLHKGRFDLGDEQTRQVVAELLPSAIASTISAGALLDDVRPELILLIERNYADLGPLSDLALARGINVIQFVSAFQDDGLVFKRYTNETKALHPRSLSEKSWELVSRMPWTEERQRELDAEFERRYGGAYFLSRRIQGWTQARPSETVIDELGLDPAKRTAVIFSHVLWDANMFYGRDLFDDQEEWFVESVRAACENDRVNWIVKLHPANVWKRRRDGVEEVELGEVDAIRDEIGALPPHVAILRPESEISTRSIFDLADWGITIRGSVGIELPCFGVPVLTAGTGFYAGLGFTVDSETRGEYLDRLRAIEQIPPLIEEQVLRARKHAYALFFLRRTRFTSFRTIFRPLEEGPHPLDHNLVLTVRSRRELERAEDLRRFADWAVASRDLDYLESPADSESRLGR
jgi:hypothetical protein